MSIASDVQKLAPGQLIDLFVLDATSIGGVLSRWHAGVNGLLGNVVWQGQTYSPFPIVASGFELSGQGTLPRPSLRVANVSGLLGLMVLEYDDLVGAKVIRKRTLSKYLDAVNFPGGVNASADPTAGFPDEAWFIDRKALETNESIEFELAAAWDVSGVQLPRRQFLANMCSWQYRGEGCGYAGPPVAAADDTPVNDLALDRCGKRLASCKLRFGETGELPFGGFPACGLTR